MTAPLSSSRRPNNKHQEPPKPQAKELIPSTDTPARYLRPTAQETMSTEEWNNIILLMKQCLTKKSDESPSQTIEHRPHGHKRPTLKRLSSTSHLELSLNSTATMEAIFDISSYCF